MFCVMKHYFIIIVALLLSTTAMAQKGIILAGELGIGSSNITERPANTAYSRYDQQYKGQDAITAVVSAGIHIGLWEFKTGVGYLRDGYIMTATDPRDPNRVYRDAIFYPHIIVPIITGWEIKVNRRWSVVPHWGVILGTNMFRSDLGYGKTELSGSDFNSKYHQQSIWVTMDLEVRYRIGRKHFLFVTPHYNFMVTDMARDVNKVPEQNSVLFNSFTLNVGIARIFELRGR